MRYEGRPHMKSSQEETVSERKGDGDVEKKERGMERGLGMKVLWVLSP